MNRLSPGRFPIIDAFKAIASQLIVLHHLAAYGPISAAAQQLFPAVTEWLYDYARMAVQVFFVVGGYLAARSLTTPLRSIRALTESLLVRYLRLVVPFFCALLLAMVSAFVARQLWFEGFIPDAPDLLQILAHIVLLQGVLDIEALSAGVWYVAVDFQLFALLLLTAWLGVKVPNSRGAFLIMVTFMAAASLFWFNRDSGYDDWAIYFFGAYAMGAMAYCAGQDKQAGSWFGLMMVIAISALLLDFRWRILLAASVAMILFLTRQMKRSPAFWLQAVIAYLSTISYALFLVHFSVLMLVNAVFGRLQFSSPQAGLAGMLSCWLASIVLADLFYRGVEQPVVTRIKQCMKQ